MKTGLFMLSTRPIAADGIIKYLSNLRGLYALQGKKGKGKQEEVVMHRKNRDEKKGVIPMNAIDAGCIHRDKVIEARKKIVGHAPVQHPSEEMWAP